jgi:hypothetical protein
MLCKGYIARSSTGSSSRLDSREVKLGCWGLSLLILVHFFSRFNARSVVSRSYVGFVNYRMSHKSGTINSIVRLFVTVVNDETE